MTNVPEAFRAAAQSGASQSFGLLHPNVQRWIWQQGWEELRDIQERSIPTLLTTERDLIIAAGTASGKTEAAFLPIASRIASAAPKPGSGFNALYISPLRALINDQFRRMEGLCEELEIPVIKWHGDVSESH
jgi:ATP-dependent Lhr-like helicase